MSDRIKIPKWLDAHQDDEEFVCIDKKAAELLIKTEVLVKCMWRRDGIVYLPCEFKFIPPNEVVAGIMLWNGRYKMVCNYINGLKSEKTFYFTRNPEPYIHIFEKYRCNAEKIQCSLNNAHNLNLDI